MISLRQWYGIFRKEVSLQGKHRILILNRLFVGPILSGATAALLYAGFFESGQNIEVGGLTASNVKQYLLVGFLIHACLNSGYYFFSWKLLREMSQGTFGLIWMGTCSPLVLFLGLSGVEIFRCFILSTVGFSILSFTTGHFQFGAWIASYLVLLTICLLGLCLGFLRACVSIVFEAGELLDHAYMIFVFLGCLYIPKSLLPKIFQGFCNGNPLYQASLFLKELWSGHEPSFARAGTMLAGALFIAMLCYVIWSQLRAALKERAFS